MKIPPCVVSAEEQIQGLKGALPAAYQPPMPAFCMAPRILASSGPYWADREASSSLVRCRPVQPSAGQREKSTILLPYQQKSPTGYRKAP